MSLPSMPCQTVQKNRENPYLVTASPAACREGLRKGEMTDDRTRVDTLAKPTRVATAQNVACMRITGIN